MKHVLSLGDIPSAIGEDHSACDDVGASVTQTRSKRKRTKNPQVSNRGVNSENRESTSSNQPECNDDTQALWKVINELKTVVDTQRQIIDKMSSRLNFVLSFLDINDTIAGENNEN